MENNNKLEGYPVTFKLFAHSAEEAEEARMAIISFISQHARQGRAVTAKKVAQAISNWDKNAIVKNQIINFFK